MELKDERIPNLISIIVPIYNAEKTLPKCLESLASQTYTLVEIILINDGSTDNSAAICMGFSENHQNTRVVSQENGGISKARNAGLDIAQGEFLLFVDSDDYVEKDYCEKLHSAIIETGADCVVSQPIRKDEGKATNEKSTLSGGLAKGKEILQEMYSGNGDGINLVEVWGKLFRNEMWKDIHFVEGMYYEDLEIMPRLYYNCEKVALTSYSGYTHMIYEESASHGKGTDDKRVSDSILIREKHIQFFGDRNDKELERAIASRLFDLIITSAKNGWIPIDQVPSVRETFKRYWKRYRNGPGFSVRTWLRNETFYLCGKRSFKEYHG